MVSSDEWIVILKQSSKKRFFDLCEKKNLVSSHDKLRYLRAFVDEKITEEENKL